MGNAFLTSGQFYYVKMADGGHTKILEESEYNDFYKRMQNQERYVKIWEVFYFWSDIREFWPVEMEEWFLRLLRSQDEYFINHFKDRLKVKGYTKCTVESLEIDITYYNDWKSQQAPE